ncbi:hypothetical protein EJ06DRAFT_269052 [Trichodelitschia bisporula]|uniref:Uncharacterized protein n=1 Tax=Trichodelitschia bisporula TaxID=703511 RepID=A0A6G1HHX5_9PEZI|nr:hypothetical protein EJ06DRAFT_269052 [Trichodelitschia bisporula]
MFFTRLAFLWANPFPSQPVLYSLSSPSSLIRRNISSPFNTPPLPAATTANPVLFAKRDLISKPPDTAASDIGPASDANWSPINSGGAEIGPVSSYFGGLVAPIEAAGSSALAQATASGAVDVGSASDAGIASVVYHSGSSLPPSASALPPSASALPASPSDIPASSSDIPASPSPLPASSSAPLSSSSPLPASSSAPLPSSSAVSPLSSALLPSSSVPPSSSAVPSLSSVLPSSTAVPSLTSAVPSSSSFSNSTGTVTSVAGLPTPSMKWFIQGSKDYKGSPPEALLCHQSRPKIKKLKAAQYLGAARELCNAKGALANPTIFPAIAIERPINKGVPEVHVNSVRFWNRNAYHDGAHAVVYIRPDFVYTGNYTGSTLSAKRVYLEECAYMFQWAINACADKDGMMPLGAIIRTTTLEYLLTEIGEGAVEGHAPIEFDTKKGLDFQCQNAPNGLCKCHYAEIPAQMDYFFGIVEKDLDDPDACMHIDITSVINKGIWVDGQ